MTTTKHKEHFTVQVGEFLPTSISVRRNSYDISKTVSSLLQHVLLKQTDRQRDASSIYACFPLRVTRIKRFLYAAASGLFIYTRTAGTCS
jgi:hypothetical protein